MYDEISMRNMFEPVEMTFTVEDADLKVLQEVLCDINIKECPWFEVKDKHGNSAKYYREEQRQRNNDAIWDMLSKVYNMGTVPDSAKAIIGDVMLLLDDPYMEGER